MADTDRLLRIYKAAVSKNEAMKKASKSARSWADAYSYAKGAGEAVSRAVFSELEGDADELAMLLDVGMRAGHADVSRICRKIQRFLNDQADLGIGILSSEYDPTIATEMAVAFALLDGGTLEQLTSLLTTEAMKVVDASIKDNFEAASGMGLSCKIVRRYDDVGLHDGTKWAKPCQWCLDREGTWDNYEDAKAAGAFARHPGCQCVITYEVGKTRTWSRWRGAWKDMSDL